MNRLNLSQESVNLAKQELQQIGDRKSAPLILETYQCYMSLKSEYLHKYLVMFYFSNLGKKIKKIKEESLKSKTQILQT